MSVFDVFSLDGVVDAAVQLSDGSTAYLENNGVRGVELKHVDVNGHVNIIDVVPTDPNIIHSTKVDGMQSIALICDDKDNLYVIGPRGDATDRIGRFGYEKIGPNAWGARPNINSASSASSIPERPSSIAAVWCDASANSGAGRILVAYGSLVNGTTGFLLFPASLTGALSIDSHGNHPSWLVSSSSHLNDTGTQISLATDVFGGNRVCALSYGTDGMFRQFRWSTFTVGSTITSVNSSNVFYIPGSATDLSDVNRVMGAGPNKWVLAYSDTGSSNDCNLEVIDTDSRVDIKGFSPFARYSAVYDEVSDSVFVYYFSAADNRLLMRVPYKVEGAVGPPEEVARFPHANKKRDIVRTVKALRDRRYVEVHWNTTA